MKQENNFEEFEQEIENTKVRSWVGEIALTIALITSSVLSFIGVVGTSAIFIIVAGILSSIYFYFSFAMFNNIRLKDIFKKSSYKGVKSLRVIGAIAVGMQLSIVILALLFKLMRWPGTIAMATMGGLGLGIIFIISLLKYVKNKSGFYVNILKRVVPYLAVVAGIFFIPQHAILEYKYKDNPEYINAVKAADKDPENKELQRKVVEERKKLDLEELDD